MEQSNSSRFSYFSLSKFLKLSIFDTIYAITTPEVNAASPTPREETTRQECNISERRKCSAGDRGKTGAGVAGSRTKRECSTTIPSKLEGSRDGSREGSRKGSGEGSGEGSREGSREGTREGSRESSREGSVEDSLEGSREGSLDASKLGDSDLPPSATTPGLLRHIHNAARNRLPQCFEGGCVSVKQGCDNNWVLGHTISFSSVSPGGYRLLMSYMNKQKPTTVPYFVMEAAPGGQMSCEFRVGPTPWTRATLVSQVADGEFYSFESILDAYFNTCSASVIAVNREFVAVHFLQSITNELSIGAEIVGRGQKPELTSASGAFRYITENHSFSATLGNRGLDLSYARVITPNLTTAAMLEIGFAVRRAVATLAYEWRAEEWTVRGSADSDGLVGATLQRALGGNNAELACAISALLNHPNDKFRLGFAVTAAIH